MEVDKGKGKKVAILTWEPIIPLKLEIVYRHERLVAYECKIENGMGKCKKRKALIHEDQPNEEEVTP